CRTFFLFEDRVFDMLDVHVVTGLCRVVPYFENDPCGQQQIPHKKVQGILVLFPDGQSLPAVVQLVKVPVHICSDFFHTLMIIGYYILSRLTCEDSFCLGGSDTNAMASFRVGTVPVDRFVSSDFFIKCPYWSFLVMSIFCTSNLPSSYRTRI